MSRIRSTYSVSDTIPDVTSLVPQSHVMCAEESPASWEHTDEQRHLHVPTTKCNVLLFYNNERTLHLLQILLDLVFR